MKTKIHLAIPHYNAPEQLDSLLNQALDSKVDSIAVLDDASEDQTALDDLQEKFPSVQFVRGEHNLGAGGNRNRVLDVIRDGVIWFLDCDMEIVTAGAGEKLRQEFSDNHKKMIGTLILNKIGNQMGWNYGHEMHPTKDLEFGMLYHLMTSDNEMAVEELRKRNLDYAWVTNTEPVRRQVDWVAEGSFALPINEFRKVGGYDAGFRYHEGQDLARRLRDGGVDVIFTPDISVRHLEIDVRSENRSTDLADSTFLFYQKHWGMSRNVYNKLFIDKS